MIEALRAGAQCVVDDVEEHLVERSGRRRRACRRREIAVDRHVRHAVLEQAEGGVEPLVHVAQREPSGLGGAGVRLEGRGDPLDALRPVADDRQQLGCEIGRCVAAGEDARGVQDRVDRVAHLVEDARRERAHHGQLLALGELQPEGAQLELGAHARQQDAGVERLGHEVVGSVRIPLQRRLGANPRGEQDDRGRRQRRVGLDVVAQSRAGAPRHHDVRDDEVGALAVDQPPRPRRRRRP